MAVSTYNLTPIGTSQFQDTANTNSAIVVKASSGTMFLVEIDNSALASVVFTKFYNSAGAVTVGTTDPDWIFRVPASTKFSFAFSGGTPFSAGLQVATVTAGGTGGVTAPATPPTVRVILT